MSDFTYDYFVAGRWRNRGNIEAVVKTLRAAGKKVYCFIENDYDSDNIKLSGQASVDPEAMMAEFESLQNWQTNPTFRKIFEADMQGLRESASLVLVFPAGLAAHMELGVAYGMSKKCYAIGQPEKVETLYLMVDNFFSDAKSLAEQAV